MNSFVAIRNTFDKNDSIEKKQDDYLYETKEALSVINIWDFRIESSSD